MEKNNILYHYTSLRTLFNIIEKQKIWLTDLHSSMDVKEMSLGEGILNKKSMEILGIQNTHFIPAHNYYALSCTDCRDSYFHFNNYGDNCKGVAIGINRNFIKDSLGLQCASILSDHLHFAEVLYDESLFENNIIEGLSIGKDESDKFRRERLYKKICNRYNACLKGPEFALEREIRFTYCEDFRGLRLGSAKRLDGDDLDIYKFLPLIGLEEFTDNETYPNRKYACFGNRIRKYYEMSLKEFGINNVIKSIIIGSKSKQDKCELEKYLHDKGVTARVYNSNIDLRD